MTLTSSARLDDGGDSRAAMTDEVEGKDDGAERSCAACKKPFVPDDDQQTVCVDCQEWRRALVIVGLFLLFFCFVVLPLLIQVLNTPKP